MKNGMIVNYPGSIRSMFSTMQDIENDFHEKEDGRLYFLLRSVSLPRDTRFLRGVIKCDVQLEPLGTYFNILLPDGRMFAGVAKLKPCDVCDEMLGYVIAAGRAIKSYRKTMSQSWHLKFPEAEMLALGHNHKFELGRW